MAASEARNVQTELIIVGGGPAGCAAALMAASVGMRSVLVEADALCAKLQHIGAINNVAGGHSSGSDMAATIAKDLGRSEQCEVQLGVRANEIRAHEDHVTVTLDSGNQLRARYAVVATGVGPLAAENVLWLAIPDALAVPTLWGVKVLDDQPGPLLVIGADRPLGTFLRIHPTLDVPVLVAYPPEDDYKVAEVRDDPRVTLLPIASLSVSVEANTQISAEWTDREGRQGSLALAAAYLNLGSAPAPPAGALVTDATGYCPPESQHPRILTAGDLRSTRFQRIMTATGSGAEAALRAYYAQQAVADGSP